MDSLQWRKRYWIDYRPGATVKFVALVAVPPVVVTTMALVCAVSGTRTSSQALLRMRNEAFTPSMVTPLVKSSPEPLMVTIVRSGPLAGEKPLIVGPPEAREARRYDSACADNH